MISNLPGESIALVQQIRKTLSICPVCLKQLPAEIVKRDQAYYLEKACANHGSFSTVIWRGSNPSFESWGTHPSLAQLELTAPDCPHGCGLCPEHLQKTCCVLVEVTRRCNLSCSFCFAQSGEQSGDPSIEQLADIFRKLVNKGNTFVQLSGGEPTVRDDLPQIVAAAKDAGCENVQLNSNGIRLAEDRAYAKALAEAGLSFVFMQFDGTEDAIHEKLRKRSLLGKKLAAIHACSDVLMGVVLVPTLVPGINDHNIGDIVTFGLSNSPAVRGVHFQPVSYLGRYPHPPRNEDRITLPEVLRAIEMQTEGKFKVSDFLPSACDHSRCGFHGDFVVLPDSLLRLTRKTDTCCCKPDDGRSHLKSRHFVARRWKRTPEAGGQAFSGDIDYGDMDAFLGRIKSHGFTITAMDFQDAYSMDIERLRRCSLHVFRDGRTIPFCSNYVSAVKGMEQRAALFGGE